MLKQPKQDNIWRHYQSKAADVFDLNYARLQFFAKRCSPGMPVLNIGVGSGYLEELLNDRKVEVCSVDPCGDSIARLQRELNMGQRARQGHSQKIPFDPGCFAKVIMTEVLEHLSDEALHETLDEVKRVLRPGGEFTGTVPYKEDLRANNVLCPHCQAQFHRWGHHRSFDTASLRDLLIQHGFSVKQIYTRAFTDFRRPGFKLFLKAVFRYALGRMGEPIVGPNLYFVVTRP
jgi:SAM-dependent methyltransferase